MDPATLTRMQIRAVLTVFRSEMRRLGRRERTERTAQAIERLRTRSLDLLDAAKARLDGYETREPGLAADLRAAREEVSDEDRLEGGPQLSVGWRGDRRG